MRSSLGQFRSERTSFAYAHALVPNIAFCRGDPCGRPVLRTAYARGRATTRVALPAPQSESGPIRSAPGPTHHWTSIWLFGIDGQNSVRRRIYLVSHELNRHPRG